MDFLIVGAGQLGSRHGQAIARLEAARSITFVDPNPESLAIAAARVREVAPGITVSLLPTLDSHVGEIFLGIIATSSYERPAALRRTLQFSAPRNLLLEKLIASDLTGLKQILNELQSVHLPTYVNCPMPFFDHYLSLANLRESNEFLTVDYTVESNSIGLVTNSIHYLDHFWRLAQMKPLKNVKFDANCLLVDSKRAGYSELCGEMSAETVAGDKLRVNFVPDDKSSRLTVKVAFGPHTHIFDEIDGLWDTWESGELVTQRKIITPSQSRLTDISITQLVKNMSPYWSTIKDSVFLHSQILRGLSESYKGKLFT